MAETGRVYRITSAKTYLPQMRDEPAMGESIGSSRYNFMCDECGMAFLSLEDYIEYYRHYHPKTIGTAIT